MHGNKSASFSGDLERLFFTPSLMRGEDPKVYAELYARVDEVVEPNDVWDQMMVADITNHFWEQQRYRRCTGTIINSKRRQALIDILQHLIGFKRGDAEEAADVYFGLRGVTRSNFGSELEMGQGPDTRVAVLDLLKKYGLSESDIDRVAMEKSVGALADLENLAFRHEVRREAIFKEVERRRDRRPAQQQVPDHPRRNGKARALANELPEKPSPSLAEPPP